MQIQFNPMSQVRSKSRCRGCHESYDWNEWKKLRQQDEYLLGVIDNDGYGFAPVASEGSTVDIWANGILFLVVALLGLLPFFSVGALGMSKSLNAFKADEGDGKRFWLTVIPVGWFVVAVCVVGLGVTAVAALRPTRAMKRTENQLLAGLGVLVCLLLLASWYFVNKQLDDAVGAANSQLSAQGNPFAGLGGAFLRSAVSFSPAIGLWLMLVVSLGIVGVNFYSIREAKESPQSEPVDSNSSLASGIRELSDLRDQGIISDEEFSIAKKKILGEN